MAITHVVALRNALADTAVDALDGGSADANGDLVIMTGADAVITTHALSNPAFDDAGAAGGNADGVANANAIADGTGAVAGTAALFKVQNRDNAEQWRGTVTATGGGGDIELSSVVIANGDSIQLSSLSYAASN